MNDRRLFATASIALIVSGCTLARSPILGAAPLDAGPGPDAPGFDASFDGPSVLDAPLADVPGLDAPIGLDAPTAADAPDATVCSGAPEVCNGRDDDCDGAIDDGVVCRACTAAGTCDDCVRFEAAGRVYQSCPPVTGLVYWRRLCATLGDGYELAVPGDSGESDALAARLRDGSLGIDANHWVGVNDFEANGSYVRVDGAPLGWAPTFGDILEPRDYEGAVVLQSNGEWDDWPLTAVHRVLCELDESAPRCTPRPGDATCDGVDDDCDGFWDEDCVGPGDCDARVFWGSVYYACTTDRTFDEGKAVCDGMSASVLAELDHRYELEFGDDFASADTWVGLVQDGISAEPGGWEWGGVTSWTSIDGDWSAMWAPGQPTTTETEDCAFIKNSSGRLEDHSCAMNRQSVLCEHRLGR